MKNERRIAQILAPLCGNNNVRSTTTLLNLYITGERQLPEDWEQPLLTVFQCSTIEELLVLYPQIRLTRQVQISNEENVFAIYLSIKTSETTAINVLGKDLQKILSLISQLQKLGISINLHIEPKSGENPDE